MKVLLLATHLNVGGIGIYTVNLARHLKTAGVDVTVASAGGDLENVLSASGIRHVTMDIRTKFEFAPGVWKALPGLNRLVTGDGYQLLHAQTRVAQVLASSSGTSTGVPFISTCHGFFEHRRLSRKLFPCWGQRVIAISDSVREHLLNDFRLTPDRVTRIYNGIELDRYRGGEPGIKDSALITDIGLDPDAPVVGTTARLSSVKGIGHLVNAFKEVVSRHRNAQLLIVGKGPKKNSLEKQVQALNMQKKVFMVPGGASIEKYLFLMDIFCMPSMHEGLGLSLMEAMAAGRACIASNVGGLPELITNEKNGILVPPGDPGALGRAILRLLDDGEFRRSLAENAKKKAFNDFSIERSVEKTIEVYREVI